MSNYDLSLVMPGDDIAVHGAGFNPLGWVIRSAMSRGPERCWSEHSSQVAYNEDGIIHVLHVAPPEPKWIPLALYGRWLKDHNCNFVVTRPHILQNKTAQAIEDWRWNYSRLIWKRRSVGNYPTVSIWVLYRNILLNPWRSRFPILNRVGWLQPSKTVFYCIQTGKWAWENADPFRWCPRVMRNVDLPGPIHTERAWRSDELKLVCESETGTFDMVRLQFDGI